MFGLTTDEGRAEVSPNLKWDERKSSHICESQTPFWLVSNMPEEMTEELYYTSQIWIGSLNIEDLFNGNGYEHALSLVLQKA